MLYVTTALRDLWGGNKALKPSADAAMMVVTYGEHQAYVTRRKMPTPPRSEVYRAPAKSDKAGCWYCGKNGHVCRDCRKRARDEANAGSAAAPPPPYGRPTISEDAFVSQETAHLVLFADGKDTSGLQARAGDVILDIGVTSTIAGAAWVADYFSRLSPYMRSTITSVDATAVFTFGGGQTQRAHERVTLPLLIGSQTCHVATCVVAGNLPMLLSRKAMASLGVVLDVAGCSMDVAALSATIPLTMSGAGHLTFSALDIKKMKRLSISATKPAPATEVAAVVTTPSPPLTAVPKTGTSEPPRRHDNWKGTSVPAGASMDPPLPTLRAFTLTASTAVLQKDTTALEN